MSLEEWQTKCIREIAKRFRYEFASRLVTHQTITYLTQDALNIFLLNHDRLQ